jgi:hypothetical protein
MSRFNSFLLSAAAGLAIAGSTITGANASYIYTVDVWTYDATVVGSVQADGTNPIAATAPTYVFNYNTQNINWSNPSTTDNSLNTGGNFIPDIGTSSFQWVSGDETAFKANLLSKPGNSTATLFLLSASVNSGIGGNLTSDDGSTLIVNGVTLIGMPGEQVANNPAASFSVAGPLTNAPLQLYYEEANGTPSLLNFNIEGSITAPVPELSTWAMMLLGFFGVGFIAYRSKSNSALRFA